MTQRTLLGALFGPDFWRLTRDHLVLVAVSLAAAVLIGVPLGVLAAKVRAVGQPILATVGVIQTIPSLALLAFLIAALGRIGTVPALVALFLYALLPIVRNTHTGIDGIRPGMRQAALALGLGARDRMLSVELPLATPTILAGVKTSAVINVGTATIAAFIGAGGYGERIVQGLALNDHTTLIACAVPAAALAARPGRVRAFRARSAWRHATPARSAARLRYDPALQRRPRQQRCRHSEKQGDLHAHRRSSRDPSGRNARRRDPRDGEEARGRRQASAAGAVGGGRQRGGARRRLPGRRRDHRRIGRGLFAQSDIVLKVRTPDASELPLVKRGSILVGLLNPYDAAGIETLAKTGVTGFAMEWLPRITRAQSMDVLSSQANIAGYKAAIVAADEYRRFMPMLMTAAGTVKAARVLVIGAGVAGLQAIATAKRLGAVIEAFDVRPAVKEQVESLGAKFVEVAMTDEEKKQAETAGGYAREMSEDYKRRQGELVHERAKAADIVITTALIPGRPAPVLIREETVRA
jgi:ABC-type proline/glycine betaine transport system permease subunit